MQFTTLLFPLISLSTLVSSLACVAGGPADQVTRAGACCQAQAGTWYQFYPNQAICVVADDHGNYYNSCVARIPYSLLDTKCIPGNGEGLSPGPSAEPTTTGRTTLTPAPAVATAA